MSLASANVEAPKPANADNPVNSGSSYGQILRSSSIIGGAQGINYAIGMVRTKLVALLLGPSGVGLVGLYVSATELVGTIAGLGIDSSGVREVAEAHGSGDAARVARTVKTLRRVCWVTGVFAWLLTAALAYPLSVWTFGSGERTWAVAVLGVTLFLAAISGGQRCVLQGTRRIGDLARLGILGAFASTVLAVALYAWLGEKGIVPVLITTAVVNLAFSWWFVQRIKTVQITQSWAETLGTSKRLINLGLAFMYGAVLAAILGLTIRGFIVREFGLEANGIYQAAWGISGMFAGFILNAMGTDFYPRLTALAHDNVQVNRLVNEQIEIGLLLALPGILGTLAFAPWLMHAFYSAKFLPGADLLPWLAIGIFGQVITFPLGFIQRAKGRVGWIVVSQTHLNFLNLVLALLMIRAYGVAAAAWAFALTTYLHGLVVFGIARRLSRFAWTVASARLAWSAAGLITAGFAVQLFTKGFWEFLLGAFLTSVAGLYSLRGIAARLGAAHRIVKMALSFPGGRFACGL
jgi:antigen flippase